MVKDAVEQRGFIGVKLYPVMGFLPYGNAEADPAAYPARLRQTGPDRKDRLGAVERLDLGLLGYPNAIDNRVAGRVWGRGSSGGW